MHSFITSYVYNIAIYTLYYTGHVTHYQYNPATTVTATKCIVGKRSVWLANWLISHFTNALTINHHHRLINEALTADESGAKQTAITAYQKALQKLTNGISTCKDNQSLNEMKCKMERCVQ